MDLTTTILLILSILLIPLVMACTSLWFYRKRLRRLLPDFYADKVRSKERYWFKVESEQLRQAAAAEAGENPGTLGSAPSRSLTLRPDEVPQEDHMESLVLDGDQVIELRQSSKASMCSTIPNGSQVSSGENDERTLARAGSKQSVTKKKSRSHGKQSRSGSKTSSRPEPQLQRGRSLSEGQLQVSQGGQTLGEELAFRGDDTWTSTHSALYGSSLMPPGAVPERTRSKESPRRQGSKGSKGSSHRRGN